MEATGVDIKKRTTFREELNMIKKFTKKDIANAMGMSITRFENEVGQKWSEATDKAQQWKITKAKLKPTDTYQRIIASDQIKIWSRRANYYQKQLKEFKEGK